MNKQRIGLVGALLLVAALATSGLAWEADFDPATYNPGVGVLTNFAVCQACLESGTFAYRWDFDGDGVPEIESDETLVTYAFPSPGFYEVTLTVLDAGGRASSRTKGILVGEMPAFAIRDVLDQGDGTYRIQITIPVNETMSGLGFAENIPQGWQVEVIDAGGAITHVNALERQLQVLWGRAVDAGEDLSFAYLLYSAYGTGRPALSGYLSGYVEAGRFKGDICGEMRTPE